MTNQPTDILAQLRAQRDATPIKLTRDQVRVMRNIIDAAKNNQPGFRITAVRVSMIGRKVSISVRANNPEWAGSMASLICGRYGHFFVGPRGGVEALTGNRSSKANQKKYPLICGWE